MRTSCALLLAALLAPAAARAEGTCTASSKPQAAKTSCQSPSGLDQCWEFTGVGFENEAKAKATCSGSGTLSRARCPEAKAGRCLVNCGQDAEMVIFYAEGDDAALKKSCEAKGRGVWLGK